MKKWILGLVVSAALPLSAQSCCWNPCDFNGCFEIGGEALWLKPTGATFQFANTNDETQTRSVTADYDWGFRIYGGYYMNDCCNFAILDWTYLRTRDTGRAIAFSSGNPSVLAITNSELLNGTRINARLRFDYDKVNLRFGRYICCGCDSFLFAYVGGRYLNIKERRASQGILLSEAEVTFNETSRFQGGGVEAGIGVEHDFFCDFTLAANFGLTTAIGTSTDRSTQFAPNQVNFPIPSATICVPGADFKIGLSYTYKCDCIWITGDFGYQLEYYWNALRLRTNVSDFTTRDRVNVGFGGIYFGLRARF